MKKKKYIYNQYKSSYRPPKSDLSAMMYNAITKDLTKGMEFPNFDIYMIDNRIFYPESREVYCTLIYANYSIGCIHLIDNIVKEIIFAPGFHAEDKIKNLHSIVYRYKDVEIRQPRRNNK